MSTETMAASAAGEPTLVQGTNWNAATWGLLLVVSGALFLDGIDLSMVNIALPSMGAELGMGTSNTSLQIGGAISLAIIAAILSSAQTPLVKGELLPNMTAAITTFSGIAVLGVLITLPRLLSSRRS